MYLALSSVYVFFGAIVVSLWYYIKYLVHQAGYETHLFRGHGSDLVNLRRLIDKEQDARKKRQYQILLYALYVSFVFAVGLFLITITLLRFR